MKSSTSWFYHFGCIQPGMPKIPKIRSLHIFAVSSEKHGGWSWFSLPTNERKSFLHFDSITLGLCSQSCPNYPKLYLKKELGDQLDFLHSDKHENLLQIDSMTLMIVWFSQVFPKFSK